MKYKVKFKVIVTCIKTIDIKNEADPYEEENIFSEDLKQDDFTIDDIYINNLKPVR